jgi:hypothetical protein
MPTGNLERLYSNDQRASEDATAHEVQRLREQYGDDLQAGLIRLLTAMDQS